MPCHARATALSFYPPAMPVQCRARGAKRAGPPPSSVPCSAATRKVGRSAGCCGDEHTANSRSISKLDSWALLRHRSREVFENSLTHPHDVHYYSGGQAPSLTHAAHRALSGGGGGRERGRRRRGINRRPATGRRHCLLQLLLLTSTAAQAEGWEGGSSAPSALPSLLRRFPTLWSNSGTVNYR